MAKEETKVAGQKQMTYDELLKAAQELSEQNAYFKQQAQQAIMKVRELSDFAMFKRLDYLFKVIELREKFPAEFVQTCAEEIMAIMTPPAEQPAGNEAKEEK